MLQSRGLVVTDPERVEKYLDTIGYYRLSAYLVPFEGLNKADGSRDHTLRCGTTFDQVLNLYRFDRELRLLIMEAIERVEVAVRSMWANGLSAEHGPHAYMDPAHFNDPWLHCQQLGRVAREVKDSKESFLRHYREQYESPFLPPIWAMVEVLSFGELSQWVELTKDARLRTTIARKLLAPDGDLLGGVLHALTQIRNVCAHHGRCWNRRFTKQPPTIKRMYSEMIREMRAMDPDSAHPVAGNRVYDHLLILAWMMRRLNPSSSWRRRVRAQLLQLNEEQQRAAGCHQRWDCLSLWNT